MLITLKNLLRRPRRTILTCTAVALGSATYMVLLTAGQGLFLQFQESAKILGAEIVVQQVGVTSPWHSAIPPGVFEKISVLPGVKRVSRTILGKTRMAGLNSLFVFGVEASDPILASLENGLNGHLIRPGADPPEILMGNRAAEHLRLRPGELIDIRKTRFRLAGVYQTGRAVLDNGGFVNLSLARILFGANRDANLLFVNLTDPDETGEIVEAINSRFPRVGSIPTSDWIESYGQGAVIQIFSRFLALLALVIAMLGVSNILHISVSERIQELAVLRAIGWTRWSVALLVLSEGLSLSLAGALLGIPLAALFLRIGGSVEIGGYTTGGLIPLSLSIGVILEGIVVCLLAGALGSLAPLIRALRIQPAEALRSL